MTHSIMGVERLPIDLRVLRCMRNVLILDKKVSFIMQS